MLSLSPLVSRDAPSSVVTFAPALPPPDPRLEAVVIAPVRNEARSLAALVGALDGQRIAGDPAGPRLETILLVNNCSDGSVAVARRLQAAHPEHRLHVVEVSLPTPNAHVGWARRLAMNLAASRLIAVGRPEAPVCSTDADSRPAPDWIERTLEALQAGADAVGGRVTLDPEDRAALPAPARRMLLLDIGYRRALEALRELYAPTPHDPFPRHHQHFGASLAVRAGVYVRAGGLPPVQSSEDVALYHALLAVGARVRHCPRVRVTTSGRRDGRARGGLADVLALWASEVSEALVESPDDAERRLARIALDRRAAPGRPDDPALLGPPGHPLRAVPIGAALRALRSRVAAVAALTSDERLARAERLHDYAVAA